MKTIACGIGLTLLAAISLAAEAVTFEPGGVTFDFPAISARLRSAPQVQEPVEIRVAAHGLLDERYAVSEGQVSLIEIYWSKTDPKDSFETDGFTFRFTFPAGIRFVDATFADRSTLKLAIAADGPSTVTFKPVKGVRILKDINFWEEESFRILVQATRGPGECGKGTFDLAYEKNGRAFAAATKTLDYFIVPRIKVKPPKRYRNSMLYGSTNGFDFATREAFELETARLVDAGMTWLVARADPEKTSYWKSHGIDVVTSPGRRCCNAFHLGVDGKIPSEDAYVFAEHLKDGTLKTTVRQDAVCPIAAREKNGYFTRETIPFLREYLTGTDGMWSNWEPWRFDGRGCVCERCRQAFVKFSGRSETEVADGWPEKVIRGGEWREESKRFRAEEHAKLVRFIDGVVREFTGGESSLGLIPAIGYIEMTRYAEAEDYLPDTRATRYAGELAWMCPWGPYVEWGTKYPYAYHKRKPVSHYFAAKELREMTDKLYPEGARPKLMGCPQGFQIGHWVTQPEHLKMSLDANFFNGIEATTLFYFPRGYDARFLKAYAEATARAAKYEDFVLDGVRTDGQVAVEPVPGTFASPAKRLSGYLPGYENIPLLQIASYDLKGRRIIAVFNFWDFGPAFFDLKVKGFGGKFRIIDEDGCLWPATRLAVGAARCRVFEIVPEGTDVKPAGEMTRARLDGELERLTPALRCAVEEDAQYERTYNDYGINPMPVL
ncbi:MAG: hypothetical protein PHW08_15260 [Kiritimatiellae bacterium]|nr:hypothetical protein [Kiritimatiellia bacterium]